MAKEFKGLYEFGEFRLDVADRRLLRGEQPVPLTLKVFDTLVCLVQNSGRLVEKEQLMKEVWSDAFVEEANISRHVWILRKALGDDEGEHRYIETVPKLGYRFKAEVRQINDFTSVDVNLTSPDISDGSSVKNSGTIDVNPVATTAVPQRQLRATSRKLKIAIGLTIISIAIFAYAFLFRRARSNSVPPIKSLAILPLRSVSGDANDDLGLGITDRIITKVSQAGTITVRPFSAIRKYAGQQIDSLEAAQQLEVDSILDGTVQREGDHLRVSVNLLRTQDGTSLWADTFDVQRDDLFKMQDKVAEPIATRLRLKLRPSVVPERQIDSKAYECYLKAKSHTGLQNARDNDEAIKLLEEAVSLDPNFAEAYADLAGEYRNKGFALAPENGAWQDKAFIAVNKALTIDPDLPEAHVSLALLMWTPAKGFPHEKIVQELRRAIDLNPNLDEAHHQLAHVYNHIGLLEKGEDEIQKAVDINPFNAGARFRVGVNLTYQGRYNEALNSFGEPNKFNPAMWAYQMSWVLFQLGRRDESLALIEKYLKDYPRDEGGILTGMKALLAASDGDKKLALSNIERAVELGNGYGHFHHTAYAIGSAYAIMSQPDQAVKWLTSAAEDGFPCYPLFEHDPNLNNLRDNPAFISFMKRLKEQWEHYRTL